MIKQVHISFLGVDGWSVTYIRETAGKVDHPTSPPIRTWAEVMRFLEKLKI